MCACVVARRGGYTRSRGRGRPGGRVEGREQTTPSGLACNRRLARVVVVEAVDLSVVVLVRYLNAPGGYAAVRVCDLYAALPVNVDVHEVEKVSIVRRARADDRAGVADGTELDGVCGRRVNSRPSRAAVVGRGDVEMPDALEVVGVLVVAAGGRAEEGEGCAV